MPSSVSARRSWLVPGLLALTLLAPLAAAPELNPLLSLTVGAALAAALLVTAAVAPRRRMTRAGWTLMALALGLVAWLVARSLLAANPAVSFIGTVSQHTGAALWLAGLAWLASAMWLADKRALRLTLYVIASCGALYATLGVIEAITSGARAWGSAAGPLENSASLGNFCAIAVFAAVAWATSARSVLMRAGAIAAAILSLAGVAVADSRSGLAGLAVGAVFVFLARRAAGHPRARRPVAIAVPALAVVLTVLLTAASVGILGGDAASAVRVLGTDRDAIWRSAAVQIGQAPLVGSGPEQFSAWVAWSFDGADIAFNGAYDPHNILLGVTLGGGVIALALWLAASTDLLQLMLHGSGIGTRSSARAAVVAMPVVLGASALFAWLTPAAVLAVAALTGLLVGTDSPAVADPGSTGHRPLGDTALAALLAVACCAVTIAGMLAFSPERAFVANRTTLAGSAAADLFGRWPDPAYASRALATVLDAGGDHASAQALLGDNSSDATWHVDLAVREILLAARTAQSDPGAWPGFVATVDRGVLADPASGLWPTLAAAQANTSGLPVERDAYARQALGMALTPQTRQYLESLGR